MFGNLKIRGRVVGANLGEDGLEAIGDEFLIALASGVPGDDDRRVLDRGLNGVRSEHSAPCPWR
jgi:hypothetical protein